MYVHLQYLYTQTKSLCTHLLYVHMCTSFYNIYHPLYISVCTFLFLYSQPVLTSKITLYTQIIKMYIQYIWR